MDSGLATDAMAGSAFPWLSLIVLLPAFGALLMPLMPGDDDHPSPWPRNFALIVLFVDLLLMLLVFSTRFDPSLSGLQLVERVSWLPSIGLEWSLGADGLSAPLVVLSGLVTFLSVAASWSVQRKCKLYFALLLVQGLFPAPTIDPPQRMTVSLAEEVGMEATAPDPVTESRASTAPTLEINPAPAPAQDLPVPPQVSRPVPPQVQSPVPPPSAPSNWPAAARAAWQT